MVQDVEDIEDPWAKHVTQIRVSEAQVTAVPTQGEMIVREGLKLIVSEGRQETLREDAAGQPAPSVLEYFCRVTLEGAAEPEFWAGTEAQVVIIGLHENGARITIAGRGAIGDDDKGSLEIEFDGQPQMVVAVER